MDLAPVIDALKATLSPQLRERAEEQLSQVDSIDRSTSEFFVHLDRLVL